MFVSWAKFSIAIVSSILGCNFLIMLAALE
jgi:hypothetical protein